MIEITQTRPDNCMAAVLASLLEVPLAQVPQPDPRGTPAAFWSAFNVWLRERGFYLHNLLNTEDFPRADLWIAGVPSFSLRGRSHVVIMEGERLRWDPARPQFKRTRRPTKTTWKAQVRPLPPIA